MGKVEDFKGALVEANLKEEETPTIAAKIHEIGLEHFTGHLVDKARLVEDFDERMEVMQPGMDEWNAWQRENAWLFKVLGNEPL